jgi:hypothetical protein
MQTRRPTIQTSLDLRGNGLRSIWNQLPERCRSDVVSLWTQLIARAAQKTTRNKGESR